MAKSREKVQQLGFWDSEVSNPDHDAVCLWAYENADLIFRKTFPDLFDHPWLEGEVFLGGWDKDEQVIAMAKSYTHANQRPNPQIYRKTLECILRTYTGYQDRTERIVGFADLMLLTEIPQVRPICVNSRTGYEDDILEGFGLAWSRRSDAPQILVEAKSVLPTVGELMRQIQLYRTAFSGHIVVVSPDDKYEQILAEQGVTFVQFSR